MTQVDKLLKYQETDEKLLKLERDLGNSEERKNFVQAKSFLTKAPEKLDALNAKAIELTAIVTELNKNTKKSRKPFPTSTTSTKWLTAVRTFLSIKRTLRR